MIVATEAHHQNGTIESGNRVLRMFFRRIRLAEKLLVLSQVVENAVYGKKNVQVRKELLHTNYG